jgi:hypothetical protein
MTVAGSNIKQDYPNIESCAHPCNEEEEELNTCRGRK